MILGRRRNSIELVQYETETKADPLAEMPDTCAGVVLYCTKRKEQTKRTAKEIARDGRRKEKKNPYMLLTKKFLIRGSHD